MSVGSVTAESKIKKTAPMSLVQLDKSKFQIPAFSRASLLAGALKKALH